VVSGQLGRRPLGPWALAAFVVMGVALTLGPSGAIVARASTPEVNAKSLLANGLTAVAGPAVTTLPSKFQDTVVFSGLTNPTAVRFSPDGRVFVAEKSGLLLEYDSLTDTTPTTVADFRSETDDYWDRGLLGLALDPNFPTSPYVYLLYTYDAPPGQTAPVWNDACPTPPGPISDGCVVTGKLVRIQLSGNAMSGSPTTLISGEWCQQFPSHSIGDLNFGADGALYVSGGDGASFSNTEHVNSQFVSYPSYWPCASTSAGRRSWVIRTRQ
jgi:glucose/arabinose dehydrogenase